MLSVYLAFRAGISWLLVVLNPFPDDNRTVEIGYSVAPTYQNRGVATAAVQQLIEVAIASKAVDCICAHTLAKLNPSTSVLKKCGMTKVSEGIDEEDGAVWKWEIWIAHK